MPEPSPLPLKDMTSPLGNPWMYASSLGRLYDACSKVSWLFGPYVENDKFWTGGGVDPEFLRGRE